MVAFDRNPQDFKYLRLLSRQFPTEQSAFTEIINLSAILNLPKGTEHFMSDVHGEYEAFMHILNNCSGVVREHVDEIFGDTLSFDEKGELCTLIYYPREKIDLVRSRREDSPTWYKTMLDQLIMVARSLSSRYTRSKVRKAIPRDYAYIIDELLHTHPDENNYRVRYHERIVESILETASADDFIESLASLIKRLAVDHLHLVGDIFDRGGGAAKIMDRLLTYHSLDIQWGNHDLLWMGAAAGEPACIATVLRNNLRYDNYEILENDYGISLRELVAFADATYTAGESITPLIKAINVLLFKLEGQIIQRHPEFDMTDRLLLDKIDHDTGTVTLADGSVWPLTTNDFPTVDPADPYTLTSQEQHIIDKLVSEFVTADHLHRHIDFLYTHGSMYKVANGNLLFHGCVPLNEDGTFSSMNCLGTWHAGRDYLDFCDHSARRAWRVGDRDALDWMWYLWCGTHSPLSGKYKIATFERYFIADDTAGKEEKDPYYKWIEQEETAVRILTEFGADPVNGKIITGHVPVKAGESPIKANGRVINIDGGMNERLNSVTGGSGYTLVSNSHQLLLAQHHPINISESMRKNEDIHSELMVVEKYPTRQLIRDIDDGKVIARRVADLQELLAAYRSGFISPKE